MSKHTPGPWRYEVDDEGGNFQLFSGDEPILAGCGCCDSPWISGVDNARLIAAAPAMYAEIERLRAALEAMLSHTADLDPMQGYRPDEDFSAVKQARAALKEANDE